MVTWVRLRDRQSAQREFVFANTHFDHRGKLARKQSAELLREWVQDESGDRPTILMGDFNATPTSEPIQALLGDAQLLSDARAVAKSADPGPKSTWNGFRQIGDTRIDHIFVTPNVLVGSFETLNPKTSTGRFASDHLPVKASVQSK